MPFRPGLPAKRTVRECPLHRTTRIGVLAMALYSPYQHGYNGVVTPDAAKFRYVLELRQTGTVPQEPLTIHQREGDLKEHPLVDMQRLAIAGLPLGSLPKGRLRRKNRGEWKPLLDWGNPTATQRG